MNTIVILVAFTIFMAGVSVICKIHFQKTPVSVNEDDIITRKIESDRKAMVSIDGSMSIGTYYLITIGIPVFLFVLLYAVTGNVMISSAVFALTIIMRLPTAILRMFSGRGQRKFTSEYGKALDQMAASLTTGQNIQLAVSDVCASPFIAENVKRHFRKIESSLRMGISVAEAFTEFANETGNDYVNQTAIALTVQSHIGNREAEVIQSIASQIKDDIINKSEVNAIVSSTTATVTMMDVISPLIFIMSILFNKPVLPTYTSSPQMMALGIVLVSMPLIGSAINHKMLKDIKR